MAFSDASPVTVSSSPATAAIGPPGPPTRTWPLSFVRFAVALSVFFGSYDQIKSRVVGDSTQRPAAATFALRALSGGLSGILTW